ncbi:hypothetical protein FACS189487_02000 [Campylobacterota bacterium]|nr:hypothetical protein FACS189487_02000 [Campylobacterota bacterium]
MRLTLIVLMVLGLFGCASPAPYDPKTYNSEPYDPVKKYEDDNAWRKYYNDGLKHRQERRNR